jgi:hypothetical protein
MTASLPSAVSPVVTDFWDVFIAHSSHDARQARALHDSFAPGFRVFLDDVQRRGGDEFDDVILAAQRASRITAVCVSSSFDQSYYAREELAIAIDLARRDPPAHRVVPVYLDQPPEEMRAVPYGLRLKNGYVVSRDGGFAGVAKQIEALLTGDNAHERNPAAAMHPLAKYPRGPMVEARFIPKSVVEAYSQLLRGVEAESVVEEANAFRATANSAADGATFIRRIFLPDPSVVGPFTYWYGVFTEAALNGPRMLAALLLTVPADRFPARAMQDRDRLLRWLEVGPSVSA